MSTPRDLDREPTSVRTAFRPAASRTIVASMLAMLVATCAAAEPPIDASQVSAKAASLESNVNSPEKRLAAAAWLLEHAEAPGAYDAIERSLRKPLTPQSAGLRLLEALSTCDEPPSRLLPLLAARLHDAQKAASREPAETRAASGADAGLEPTIAAIVDAIASFRSRFAARVLVDLTDGDCSEELAASCYRALARLTGRDDLGSDHQAWERLVTDFEHRNELEWQRELSTRLARRDAASHAESAALVGRLIETTRRLHLSTPAEKRPALLTELMRDPQPELRNLGFELVQRELSNNGSIDASVGTAAAALLGSESPRVRAQAALLVRQIAPPEAGEAVASALEHETDPQAASNLLLAAARWPTPASVNAVLAWLGREGETRPAAIEACLQISRSVTLSDPNREHVLEVLRALKPEELTGAAATLLIELGADEDRARLAPLLRAGPTMLRLPIAEALVWFPEHAAALIDAAEVAPELVPVAAKAVMVNGPTAAEVIRLMRMRAATPEIGRAAISGMAPVMAADQLLPVTLASTDPLLRSSLLNELISPVRAMSERTNPAAAEAIVRGVLLLAEEDLAQGNPGAALSLLDGSPIVDESPLAPAAASLRVPALLASGKIEEASRLKAPLEAWLRGFDLAKATPGQADVAEAILAKFGESLDATRRASLEALAANHDLVGPPESK